MKKGRMDGFTLIEMLLSISILALISGASLPLYLNYQVRNDLAITAQKTAESARRAAAYARSGAGDSGWGIYITSTAVTVFKGTTYATRDMTADESFMLPNSVTQTGGGEIDFTKLTGTPNTAGSITFSSTQTSSTRTVTINSEGAVS